MFLFADSLFISKRNISKDHDTCPNHEDHSDQQILHMKHEDIVFVSSEINNNPNYNVKEKNIKNNKVSHTIAELVDSMHNNTVPTIVHKILFALKQQGISLSPDTFLTIAFIKQDSLIIISSSDDKVAIRDINPENITIFSLQHNSQEIIIHNIKFPNLSSEYITNYIKWNIVNTNKGIKISIGSKITSSIIGVLGYRLRLLATNMLLYSEAKTALFGLLTCGLILCSISISMPTPRGLMEKMQAVTFRFMGDLSSIENSAHALRQENAVLNNEIDALEMQLAASFAENTALEAKMRQMNQSVSVHNQALSIKAEELSNIQQRVLDTECLLDRLNHKINNIAQELGIVNESDSSADPSELLLKIYGIITSSISSIQNTSDTNGNKPIADSAIMDVIYSYETKIDELSIEIAKIKQHNSHLMQELDKSHQDCQALMLKSDMYAKELEEASCSSVQLWMENKNMKQKINSLTEKNKSISEKINAQNAIIQQLNIANMSLSNNRNHDRTL